MKITKQEVAEDRDFIRKKVIEHNVASLPGEVKSKFEQMSFIVRNEAGEIIGGLTTTGFWRQLHIRFSLGGSDSQRPRHCGKADGSNRSLRTY